MKKLSYHTYLPLNLSISSKDAKGFDTIFFFEKNHSARTVEDKAFPVRPELVEGTSLIVSFLQKSMVKFCILMFAIYLSTQCSANSGATNPDSCCYNLDASTNTIIELIYCNCLGNIIEHNDPQELKDIVKNFSPAELAYQSEISKATLPVLLHIYQDETSLYGFVEQLAHEFHDRIKMIHVHAKKLFSIARKMDIMYLPTIVLIRQNKEIERLEGNISFAELKDAVRQLVG